MNLTLEQLTYIAERGPKALSAVAGSGKTTTMVEDVRLRKVEEPNATILCVAFNKKIALTLEERMPKGVECKTMHSLGMRAWNRVVPRDIKVETNKTWKLWGDIAPESDEDDDRKSLFLDVKRLVGLLKGAGAIPPAARATHGGCRPLGDWANRNWRLSLLDFLDEHEFDLELQARDDVIELATKLLEESIITSFDGVIDFDDMLYMPVCFGGKFNSFDRVMIDEAQDINDIQRAMLHMVLRPGGTLCAVGDPYQAIYAFRGANHNSFNLIIEEFGLKTFPLSCSFRCPIEVVKLAQRIVPHITWNPAAEAGSVTSLPNFGPNVFTPDDAVICRNTKPLVFLAFSLLRNGVACFINGSDIGASLNALIRRLKAKSLPDLEERLRMWEQNEIARLTKRGSDAAIEVVSDKAATIRAVIDGVASEIPDATISDVTAQIKRLFSDPGSRRLTLSTIHRSKGLEWQRVFILDRHLMPSRYATSAAALQQEANLEYVAITRAMRELYFITSDSFDKEPE